MNAERFSLTFAWLIEELGDDNSVGLMAFCLVRIFGDLELGALPTGFTETLNSDK